MTIDGVGEEQPTLDLADPAMTPAERKLWLFSPRPRLKGLHADVPGSGPKGESCGSCFHLYRRQMSRTYLKCELCRPHWTGGGGTDVKARDPACSKWAPQ